MLFACGQKRFATARVCLAVLILLASPTFSHPAFAQSQEGLTSTPPQASGTPTLNTQTSGTPASGTQASQTNEAISTSPNAPSTSGPAATATEPTAPPLRTSIPGDTAPEAEKLPRDLSPWGMFMAADWVVKSVMIGLAFASVLTWTVWLAKGLELMAARRRARRALAALGKARSLAEASVLMARIGGPAARLVQAARIERELSSDTLVADGVKERVASRLERIEAATGRRAMRGTGVLATIGSTSPFVGLFGTVWGIMNSFIGISKAQTTNLAVVAPGIAEALLATALGLVAAIPAVVIYNMFSRWIAGYRVQIGDAAAEVQRLVSRDLDRDDLGHSTPARRPARHMAAAE